MTECLGVYVRLIGEYEPPEHEKINLMNILICIFVENQKFYCPNQSVRLNRIFILQIFHFLAFNFPFHIFFFVDILPFSHSFLFVIFYLALSCHPCRRLHHPCRQLSTGIELGLDYYAHFILFLKHSIGIGVAMLDPHPTVVCTEKRYDSVKLSVGPVQIFF